MFSGDALVSYATATFHFLDPHFSYCSLDLTARRRVIMINDDIVLYRVLTNENSNLQRQSQRKQRRLPLRPILLPQPAVPSLRRTPIHSRQRGRTIGKKNTAGDCRGYGIDLSFRRSKGSLFLRDFVRGGQVRVTG